MKKIIVLITFIIVSCNRQEEKIISSVNVDYVNIEKNYGKLFKKFKVTETIIRNNDYLMFIYKDTSNFKRVDTLKFFKNGHITFNNTICEDIGKVNVSKGENASLHKIYIPRNSVISADDISGEILYFSSFGIIARNGIAANYISFYKPNINSKVHIKILNHTLNFKKHPKEL